MNVRYRQLRGLIIHWRRAKLNEAERVKTYGSWYGGPRYRRGLIDSGTVQQNETNRRQPDGTIDRICCWCELPRPDGKRRWCGIGCVKQYIMAQGNTVMTSGQPVISMRGVVCAECGRKRRSEIKTSKWDSERTWVKYERFEVDHIVALSLAFWRKDERARVRAYLPENLQWLCRECHTAKTADDRRRITNLQACRPETWVRPGWIRPGRIPVHDDQLKLL